jgi:hypothetical protein
MSNDGSGAAWLFWLAVIGVFIFLSDVSESKWRYAFFHRVHIDHVTVQKKPPDCDFLTAPLGRKNCHFDKVLATTMWSMSTAGKPIMSLDDGKSWFQFTPEPGAIVPQYPKVEDLYVSWKRMDD